MSHLLKVAMIDAILSLRQRGWSQRRIARELGIDRETVARYLHQHTQPPKPAHAPSGSEEATVEAKPAKAPLGSERQESSSKPAKAPLGSEGGTEKVKASD